MDDNSFFSIDKLIEFGMGMAVAQQMVKTMNYTIDSMNSPGVMKQPFKNKQKFFYVMLQGKQAGPFSEQELVRLIADKKVVKETYIWLPNMPNWKMAEQIPEVLKMVALSPPPFQENN